MFEYAVSRNPIHETAYSNIMNWLYNYGGACSGGTFSLIQTLYGNASLWGMLAAPFCIRKWGKKSVLIVTNIFNIIFILSMLLFTDEITPNVTIWLVMSCLWLNALMGSFAHILNPSIQADIRDYQQYVTGERIDGMFSAVNTIGTVLALATSSVLPFIYEKNGITAENAKIVTSRPEILNRVLDLKKGTTVGDVLADQLANGQDNYSNPNSALYDPEILLSLINVLVVVAAFGALMNVIPFFWYDFNERKQKSVVRVLKVRALFEDYGNGITNDAQLVEAIDIIRNSREMADRTPIGTSKKDYKKIKNKKDRKAAMQNDEEIEIAKFVCDELDKFSTETYMYQYNVQKAIYNAGLKGLKLITLDEINAEMANAKAMPKATKEEKNIRKFAIEVARNKKSALKALNKYFANEELVQPDFAELEKLFDIEDACDEKLKALYLELKDAKKAKDSAKVKSLKTEIKSYEAKKAEARKASKAEMDRHAYFARAAKPYLDAEKLVKQEENYKHFDDIAEMYDEAKARYEQAQAEEEARILKEKAEAEAYAAQLKAEKAAKKAAKKK